jgi:uncharacterized iron-regulated protein
MRFPILFKITLVLLIAAAVCGCSVSHVMRVQNRETIPVEAMLGELRDARVVFIGELHDTPSHHRLQLEVIKAKLAAGRRVAIGMEMFETESQPALDDWSAGKLPESSFKRLYEWSWRNMPWGLYRDILIFARDHKLPVLALNAPRSLVQQVSHQGLASLSEQELGKLPPDVATEIGDDYFQLIASQYPGHGTGGNSFRFICEAQMLRNRVMARTIADYVRLNPETAVIVIAGGGHARRQGGVPAELAAGIDNKVVLPTMPFLTGKSVSMKDGDYLMEESDPLSWLLGSP